MPSASAPAPAAKRTIAISPLARSSSVKDDANTSPDQLKDCSGNTCTSHILHNASSRLVAAAQWTQDPVEDPLLMDDHSLSSLEHASDHSGASTPVHQGSTGSFTAARHLQPMYQNSYSSTSTFSSTLHHNGHQLTRTNTDSTDVLVSVPTSMEASRQNSHDEDDHAHHNHHAHHNGISHHYHHSNDWVQRRKVNPAFQHFELQPPPKKQLKSDKPAQQDDDADLHHVTSSLVAQHPLNDPTESVEVVSAPDNEEEEEEEYVVVVVAEDAVSSSDSEVPMAASVASSSSSSSSGFSFSFSSPVSTLAKKSSSFFSRRKDSKLARKKSARETSHGIFHDLKRFLKNRSTSPTLSPTSPMEKSSSSSGESSNSNDHHHKSHRQQHHHHQQQQKYSRRHHHHGAHGNAIETDLRKKYGKIGKVIGSGAGGTVRVICRDSDHKQFAIKQFRKRKPTESERSYIKKLTSEYCLGSTFHHPNIIETLDIIQEQDNFYEIMEFAKYELFTAVMSGAMGRDEIACCFRGVCEGVAYLHEMGVAHRDLKLDNVVMSEKGIVKIIDFGCSMVYQLPFEKQVRMAKGISGSDPYIAPEVFTTDEHDPRLADVWSLGIILVCMTIGRFPWRLAKTDTDPSYESFANSSGSGKARLLKLMPREARPILGRMLQVDPKKRALMTDVLQDSWVKGIEACTVEDSCLHHSHHLNDDGTAVWNPHPKPRFGGAQNKEELQDDDNDDEEEEGSEANNKTEVRRIVQKKANPANVLPVNSQVPVAPVH